MKTTPKTVFDAVEARQTVKALIKELGFDDMKPKFRVRWTNNPFGGDGKFFVAFTTPEGVTIATSGSPRTPGTRFYGNDPRFVSMLQTVSDKLRELTTNVRL